jgi:L,D-peptidoglycan transpeptidase YkuD (ErfK/YbiS/YcfS/YnhG family)
MPPQTTRLGGEIYIHGRGSRSDWTLGCIALDDDAMKELYDAIPVGTVVRIEP